MQIFVHLLLQWKKTLHVNLLNKNVVSRVKYRDGVYYRQSITITITLPSITITFQIFKSITITITLQSITSITFYYFLLHFMRLVQIRT